MFRRNEINGEGVISFYYIRPSHAFVDGYLLRAKRNLLNVPIKIHSFYVLDTRYVLLLFLPF